MTRANVPQDTNINATILQTDNALPLPRCVSMDDKITKAINVSANNKIKFLFFFKTFNPPI